MARRLSRRQMVASSAAVSIATLLAGCGTTLPRQGIYIAGPQGAPRWIAETNGAPAWAPDGSALGWADEAGVNVWNLQTDDVTLVSDIPAVGRPAWSPDTRAIAFLDPRARVLQSLNLESRVATPLALLYEGIDGAIRPPIVVRGGPAWSPTGSSIAFICWDGRADQLCLVDVNGDIRQQLTTLGASSSGTSGPAASSVTSMAWSPDGSAIAVAVQAEQRGATAGIYRVELGARTARRLTNMVANAPLIWNGETEALIYSSTVEGRSDVYQISQDGGQPDVLTRRLADGARWPTTQGSDLLAAVSGQRVAVMQAVKPEPRWIKVDQLSPASPAWQPGGEQIALVAASRPIRNYP